MKITWWHFWIILYASKHCRIDYIEHCCLFLCSALVVISTYVKEMKRDCRQNLRRGLWRLTWFHIIAHFSWCLFLYSFFLFILLLSWYLSIKIIKWQFFRVFIFKIFSSFYLIISFDAQSETWLTQKIKICIYWKKSVITIWYGC